MEETEENYGCYAEAWKGPEHGAHEDGVVLGLMPVHGVGLRCASYE